MIPSFDTSLSNAVGRGRTAAPLSRWYLMTWGDYWHEFASALTGPTRSFDNRCRTLPSYEPQHARENLDCPLGGLHEDFIYIHLQQAWAVSTSTLICYISSTGQSTTSPAPNTTRTPAPVAAQPEARWSVKATPSSAEIIVGRLTHQLTEGRRPLQAPNRLIAEFNMGCYGYALTRRVSAYS